MDSQTESYSLILNSQNTKNIVTSTNLNSYTYYVNWDAVLPKKPNLNVPLQKWNVNFCLKSIINTADDTLFYDNILLAVNFGQTNSVDNTMSPTTVLGIVYPVFSIEYAGEYNFYYTASAQDNTSTTINYPTTNLITVSFNDFNSATAVTMEHYVLKLTFTPIKNF